MIDRTCYSGVQWHRFLEFRIRNSNRVRKTHLVRAPCAFRHRVAASTPSLAAIHLI